MVVKLKDVAKAAGVAINTASSILNSRKDSWASEETKQRVRDAAEKLGYTPNRIARGLSLGKTNTIGLIIPDLQNPFYSALVTEIETEERYIIISGKLDNNSLYDSETELTWKCVNCGNIYVGKKPPVTCPVCKKPFTWYAPIGLTK